MLAQHPGLRIADRYQSILERIEQAAVSAGRKPSEIRLVVVTKGQPNERIEEVILAGARVLGENYLEEAADKIAQLSHWKNLEWHMIGHVQSRKAAGVVETFDLVQSIDSVKLARKLDNIAQIQKKILPVYLQFNMSGEHSKHGFHAWNEIEWEKLLPEVSNILALEHLETHGMMTLPPYFDEPEQARVYFRQLRRLRDFLADSLRYDRFSELSMGMSGDFQAAIAEGATTVRIGTAIMGERDQSA